MYVCLNGVALYECSGVIITSALRCSVLNPCFAFWRYEFAVSQVDGEVTCSDMVKEKVELSL
jgi:hypothetical protein